MKKIITLVVVAAVVCFSIGALAEGVDLASMTEDELLALRDSIDNELLERGSGYTINDKISSGDFVVGVDIKAGTYEFVISDTERLNEEPDNIVRVCSTETGDAEWSAYCSEVGSHFTIALTEGTTFVLRECSGYIKAVEPSWVP